MTLPEQQQERFSRLPWPIHKIKFKTPEDLFKVLPGLRRFFQQIPEFDGKEVEGKTSCFYDSPDGLGKLICYIVFMYDPETDLTDEYPDDVSARKHAAAKEAGFKREKNGKWPKHVQAVLDFEDPDTVDLIIDYLKVRKNHLWREIKFLEEELDRIYRIRATDPDRALREKLDLSAKSKREELVLLYKQFFAEHRDLKKAAEASDIMLPISPENVFKELRIPPEVYQIPQIKDVPTPARLFEKGD